MIELNQAQINRLIWDRSVSRHKSKDYVMERLRLQSVLDAQIRDLEELEESNKLKQQNDKSLR